MPECRLNGFEFLLYFRSKKEAAQQGSLFLVRERGLEDTMV